MIPTQLCLSNVQLLNDESVEVTFFISPGVTTSGRREKMINLDCLLIASPYFVQHHLHPSQVTSRRCKPRKPMVSRHGSRASSSRRPGKFCSNSPIAVWASR